MANNIKGITIQIGGDTTKLDKALAGTNKQIKTTQSELKAVEKALKLDPGNTTLLAQKQRLLADGVGQTAEKLKTLKQAAETADEALVRGKNYEAKYEPLQAKVEETTKSLQALVAQQGDMEAGLASGKISGRPTTTITRPWPPQSSSWPTCSSSSRPWRRSLPGQSSTSSSMTHCSGRSWKQMAK